MTARRGRGEGGVYKRASDGRWVGAIRLEGGRRRTVTARTKSEVLRKLHDLRTQLDTGLVPAPGRGMTLGAYLAHWTSVTLPACEAAGRLRPSTRASYTDIVERQIVPVLGSTSLAKLTPAQVRSWLSTKQAEPSARGRPRSARTVAYYHAVLRKALTDAIRDELVARNVAALVEPPTGRGKPAQPLTTDEAKKVLVAAADDRLGVLWLLMLALGLRKGEALGLRWDDLDLEEATLVVRRSIQRQRGSDGRWSLVEAEPKTEASKATLALPAHLVVALRDHRQAQRQERIAATRWLDPGIVLATPVGTYLDPSNVQRAWRSLCTTAGVRTIRIHDLRHSAATFMHGAGVDLKVIQRTLRHTRLSTTADIYTSVLIEVERQAADRMDEVLRKLTS